MTNTERKHIRKNFGKRVDDVPIPYLLANQMESYRDFLTHGISKEFESVFPLTISSNKYVMEYMGHRLQQPIYDVEECKRSGKDFSASLWTLIRLSSLNENGIEQASTQEIYMGDIPMMTRTGTFIINGTERVVIGQLHRSPGVFFEQSEDGATKELLFSARVIPYRGSWLDFEFDSKNIINVRIDRKKKLPVTVFLKALGYSTEDILDLFFDMDSFSLRGNKWRMKNSLRRGVSSFDVIHDGKIIIQMGDTITSRRLKEMDTFGNLYTNDDSMIGKILGRDVFASNGKIKLARANDFITAEKIKTFKSHDVSMVYTLHMDTIPYMSNTLRESKKFSRDAARSEIYQIIRPGEIPTKEGSDNLFHNLFFDAARYDISQTGRMKFNRQVERDWDEGPNILYDGKYIMEWLENEENEKLTDMVLEYGDMSDIIDAIKVLLKVKNKKRSVDDIDHLGNRRVRGVGELIGNQLRLGLMKISRMIGDRGNYISKEDMPMQLISPKPITMTLREFFSSSQLSQFMEQVNPLAEITHKRRISALGPGGLNRNRAGFEVRDVHPTHYGKICTIETPEGANIGLINSLAIYAKTNAYGFLETPYRKIKSKKTTSKITWLSALEEEEYTIAQANATVKNQHLVDSLVASRFQGEAIMSMPEKIQYMDVSPKQIVSVAASLIPFLEHDDANRALMGSNMQRQALPVLRPEIPLVGTGMERVVANDSGATIIAVRDGIVDSIDASRITVRVNSANDEPGIDVYNITKFMRSNQNTCIHQRSIVSVGEKIVKGDVLADSLATSNGELALGQNLLVAFMPWHGYNFEDAIVISERLIKEDRYTSIHIEEFSCSAMETKLGPEEITSDIPNTSTASLSRIDEYGIVYVGANVKTGDILVGKVTPKSETYLTSEEKLLKAIFGEKAANVKDTSLRVPPGITGTVIGVQMFRSSKVEKDARFKQSEEELIDQLRKELRNQYKILQKEIFVRLRDILIGHVTIDGRKITKNYLKDIPLNEWFDIAVQEKEVNDRVQRIRSQMGEQKSVLRSTFKEQKKKIISSDDLAPNVLKTIKVTIAVKRSIKTGDKLAGRHGNKGVISITVPEEDMPFMEDGTPVDIILNPLGVPSRMNIGQVLETHLGWAAKQLGVKMQYFLDAGEVVNAKSLLQKIYGDQIKDMSKSEIKKLAYNIRNGVPMTTPIFDGASESEIKEMLALADLPSTGQTRLIDGRTGEYFDRLITVGYMYIMKLNHLVDEKMHARSTGPYSMVTQQPLGGKAQFGGQRLGEMEVWALQAYGAAHTLQEMLTVKSDDIDGRTKVYRNIVDGKHETNAGIPESFNVLVRELRALGLDIEMEHV